MSQVRKWAVSNSDATYHEYNHYDRRDQYTNWNVNFERRAQNVDPSFTLPSLANLI